MIPGIGKRYKESFLNIYIEQKTIKPPIQLLNNHPFELTDLSRSPIYTVGGNSGSMKKKKIRWNYGNGFGGIFLRPTDNGKDRFYIWFYDENGARQRKVVKDAINKEQAEAVLFYEVQKVFERKYRTDKREKRITFCEFAKVYLESHAKPKKKSAKCDEGYLNGHLIPFFGKLELSEITPLHVQNFIVEKIRNGLKRNSINRYLQVLRAMMNLAQDYGYKVEKNPVRQRVLFNEAEYRRTRVLSYEEEKRLLKEVAPHLRPIIQCALQTGMRLQEILKLQKDDLNFSQSLIIIRPENNKTGNRDVIPMSANLKELFKKLLAENNGRTSIVFYYLNPHTKELQPLKDISKPFSTACRRAKIKNLQFRDLRRTCATRLHEKGIDPLIIQRLLRHSSFKISEEVYIQSSLKQMRDAIEKMSEKELKKPENQPPLTHHRPTSEEKSKRQDEIPLFSMN